VNGPIDAILGLRGSDITMSSVPIHHKDTKDTEKALGFRTKDKGQTVPDEPVIVASAFSAPSAVESS
jgi:hypothetical protein